MTKILYLNSAIKRERINVNYSVLLNIAEPNKLHELFKIQKHKHITYKIPKTQHENC